MEHIVSQIFGPVVKILNDHITKHLGYVTSFTKNVNNMTKKMKDLEDKSADVKQHMERNNVNNKEIPTGVPGWLNDVENIKKDIGSTSSNGIGCLNIKMRYRAGRKAWKDTERIDELLKKCYGFDWTNAPIPTGILNFEPSSSTTSTPSSMLSGGDGFKSRDRAFNDALKLLQQDDKVIALCGMAGVGKTTMMEQLNADKDVQKLFGSFVKVAIGENPNMFSIQNDIALCLGGESLQEVTLTARADSLCTKFKNTLKGGQKKILVMLDDVWKKIELKDIGLPSPLPNGLKLLLTSRHSNICAQIAADVGSDLRKVEVDVLEEAEAQSFFFRIATNSKQDDHELYQIGCAIVKECGYLPLAIKIIAGTLKSQENFVWRDTLLRLKNNELLDNVKESIKISYENIKEKDDKDIFLHCSLFPEDFNIPIEHLMRYAWGLKLLKNVYSLREARDRTNTCVRNLIDRYLLINGDHPGCVKMHDLVLAFALDEVSETWIINHGDVSKWGRDEISESCRTISLTCMGMLEFPREFKYPNLSLLKLMHGKSSLKYPKDFYENIETLKVIAYSEMQYPLLSRPLQCCTNLKALCLDECELMFDCSFVGDLVHLEVLSFAHCRIRKLPSAIGNLKKLKLLDLTECVNLHIDDSVFKNLVKLEELYMRVSKLPYNEELSKQKPIRFTDANFKELAMLSTQLCALEVEFVEKTQLENVSFEKLDRFKISIGCMLEKAKQNEKYSFKNTLKLVTDRSSDILDFKFNEMFKKTEQLYLQVKDMIRLKDVVPNHQPFFNLKDLVLYDCAKLKYLFTISMASGLRKLERLEIRSCSVLEALIHNDESEINSVGEMIKFEKLKLMSLKELPKLESLFLIDNAVELPQLVELEVDGLPNFTSIYPVKNNISSLLNSKVKISKLEKLNIYRMEKLKQIWEVDSTSEVEVNTIFMLREIEIRRCSCLENIFPTNPTRLMHRLERLRVIECDSIEEIFNIDLGCVSDVEAVGKSSLRSIDVYDSKKLRHVWRIKGGENNSSLIHGFEAVENVEILDCKRFENVFTPTNTKFDMRALTEIRIEGPRIKEEENEGVEVLFEIEDQGSPSHRELVVTTTNNQQYSLLPNLQRLGLSYLKRMSDVWKCNNWNKFFLSLQKQSSPFQNLTTIQISQCNKLKYLFSPLMAKLLSNLKTLEIAFCNGMEEVVSNRDDEDEEMTTSTTHTFFPHLHSLEFGELKNLKVIGGVNKFSQVGVLSWSLCQYSREIFIQNCAALSRLIPCYAAGQMHNLQVLKVSDCESLTEVFETQGMNNNNGGDDGGSGSDIDEGNGGDDTTTLTIPRLENIKVPQLSNLKKVEIMDCNLLKHVFTFSSLESLTQLQELMISECEAMNVIVNKETGDQKDVIVFPRLKCVTLSNLPNLNGFFLGMNEFQWPLLEKVTLEKCPQMMVFTSGQSTTPKLRHIHTRLGKHSLECGLNFHVATDFHETGLTSSEGTSLCSTTSKPLPAWSFHNLIELDMEYDDVNCIIPSNELQQLQKMQRMRVYNCQRVEEVFEVEALMEGTTQTVVQIPNLTQIELSRLPTLKYIWRSNHHHHEGRILKFPNLTTLHIYKCNSLKHVFTSFMVGSLQQLQDLHISVCSDMEVIVKDEEEEESECDTKVKEIEMLLPCLKSLKLKILKNLKGFCKGKVDFSWPSLHRMEIVECPVITVFTKGHVATPALNMIDTSFGRCDLTEDINSFIETKLQEGFSFS